MIIKNRKPMKIYRRNVINLTAEIERLGWKEGDLCDIFFDLDDKSVTIRRANELPAKNPEPAD